MYMPRPGMAKNRAIFLNVNGHDVIVLLHAFIVYGTPKLRGKRAEWVYSKLRSKVTREEVLRLLMPYIEEA